MHPKEVSKTNTGVFVVLPLLQYDAMGVRYALTVLVPLD